MFKHRITSWIVAGMLVALPTTAFAGAKSLRDDNGHGRRVRVGDVHLKVAHHLHGQGFVREKHVMRTARVFARLNATGILNAEQLLDYIQLKRQNIAARNRDSLAHLPRRGSRHNPHNKGKVLISHLTAGKVLHALRLISKALDPEHNGQDQPAQQARLLKYGPKIQKTYSFLPVLERGSTERLMGLEARKVLAEEEVGAMTSFEGNRDQMAAAAVGLENAFERAAQRLHEGYVANPPPLQDGK